LKAKRGAHHFEGNFFVPSPTANLVGATKKDTKNFSGQRGCEDTKWTSQPLCLFGKRFVFFDRNNILLEEIIVMNRRYFWLIPECVKFRTVFEDAETILGINEDNEHRLFRKDTGKICFCERETLKSFIADFLEKEFSEKTEEVGV
jgi:hypothetical protein